ncbi:hypothetical protein JIQ42_07533 [Leishmania sp. Namibia]|uniref:hypothetical protein n=1 Tax=Leishmania sp. Namibia TaxID=2802991 RepID=UPI001B5EC4E0|nr:hypothetical protein JIQ42_07533 [Leishmania sp. Namibia]
MDAQRGGSAASDHGSAIRRSRLAVLSVSVLLVVLLSGNVEHAQGFAFAPLINTFAKPERSGSKSGSRLLCQESGGSIAGEPTAAAHAAVIQAVRDAGAGAEWYAYLAASTTANPTFNCPPPLTEQVLGSAAGQSFGCYWRWNHGRWSEMDDDPNLPLYMKGAGVTFYVGNYFAKPQSGSVKVYGPYGGFPSWFNQTAPADSQLRPSAMFGQDLLVVGSGDTSTWSDNRDSGGYDYAGFSFSRFYNRSSWDAEAQRATRVNFWAACQTQGPSRVVYESPDTSSKVQNNWWVIFFSFLTLLCLVAFIVTACCQDNEDMDEPPEDAPAWAQEETNRATHTKSFVSTRSFVQQRGRCASGDDAGAENSEQQLPVKRQGSLYGAKNNAADQLPPNRYPNPLSGPDGVNRLQGSSQHSEGSRLTNNWV